MANNIEEVVRIDVPGGPTLEGSLGRSQPATGGLVICHPHPLYGGDMDNPVVVRAAEVARELGVSTLRFNFRGVGASGGVHAGGQGEQEDLKAAARLLRAELSTGRPLGLAGYSFGAWVAARVATDLPVRALALIAPPLAMLDFAGFDGSTKDTLLVSGTRDAYCSVGALEQLAAHIAGAHVVTIDGADHFFFGKLYPLGEAIRSWAARWAAG